MSDLPRRLERSIVPPERFDPSPPSTPSKRKKKVFVTTCKGCAAFSCADCQGLIDPVPPPVLGEDVYTSSFEPDPVWKKKQDDWFDDRKKHHMRPGKQRAKPGKGPDHQLTQRKRRWRGVKGILLYLFH